MHYRFHVLLATLCPFVLTVCGQLDNQSGDADGGGGIHPGELGPRQVTWKEDTPEDCRPDELGLSVTAEVSWGCTVVEDDPAAHLQVAFSRDGRLLGVAELACEYYPLSVAPSRIECSQYFTCEACEYHLTSGTGEEWSLIASTDGCPTAKYCEYMLGNWKPNSGSSCGEPCTSGCCSPSGLSCCEPPFCGGDCVGSPCC